MPEDHVRVRPSTRTTIYRCIYVHSTDCVHGGSTTYTVRWSLEYCMLGMHGGFLDVSLLVIGQPMWWYINICIHTTDRLLVTPTSETVRIMQHHQVTSNKYMFHSVTWYHNSQFGIEKIPFHQAYNNSSIIHRWSLQHPWTMCMNSVYYMNTFIHGFVEPIHHATETALVLQPISVCILHW